MLFLWDISLSLSVCVLFVTHFKVVWLKWLPSHFPSWKMSWKLLDLREVWSGGGRREVLYSRVCVKTRWCLCWLVLCCSSCHVWLRHNTVAVITLSASLDELWQPWAPCVKWLGRAEHARTHAHAHTTHTHTWMERWSFLRLRVVKFALVAAGIVTQGLCLFPQCLSFSQWTALCPGPELHITSPSVSLGEYKEPRDLKPGSTLGRRQSVRWEVGPVEELWILSWL